MSVSPGEKEEVERVEGVTFFKTCYTTELRHPPDAQGAGVVSTPKVLEPHLNTTATAAVAMAGFVLQLQECSALFVNYAP